MNDILMRFSSRKFLLCFGTVLLIVLNKYLGLGMSVDDITKIVVLVVGFTVAEGARDAVGAMVVNKTSKK